MKKILFIQHNSSTSGGVWSVNERLAHYFIEKDYEVKIVCVRGLFDKEKTKDLIVESINSKEEWNTPNKKDILNSLRTFKFIKAISSFNKIIKRKKDIKKLNSYINEDNPNYIIVSQYQMLDGIPKSFLNKTIAVHHSSFSFLENNKANVKTYFKYNGIVKYCWLSKNTMNKAIKFGFKNNCYIYNPIKFETKKIADVKKNKTLIVLTRISKEKRLDLMIEIVKVVFQNEKFKDWKFLIYGSGEFKEELIKDCSQIEYRGITNDSLNAYLNSSINLNTSSYEGFSMSVLEAMECGVPTVSFDFGESASEQIINNKTGLLIEQDQKYKFIKNLETLMKDSDKLFEMSKEAKEFSNNFNINIIGENWLNLFQEIERNN